MPEARTRSHLGVSTEALCVLMVDDNPDDVLLFSNRLEDACTMPLKIDAASSLAAGLELLQEHVYHAVIYDINLPDSKGAHGIEQILAARPACAIIALSGYQEQIMGHEALALGAEEYLCKQDADGPTLFRAICHGIERKNRELRFARMLTQSTADLFSQLNGRYMLSAVCHERSEGMRSDIRSLKKGFVALILFGAGMLAEGLTMLVAFLLKT